MSILSPAPGSRKKRHRIGRGPGSGSGKTSGKGHKGQRARSGYSRKPGFEGGQMPLSRRLPKRGFRHQNRFPMHEVNLESIEMHFAAGAEVTPEALVQAGVAAPCRGGVKVLARGELTKAVTVRANAVSAGARQKIEAAGGTVELIAAPRARQVAQKAAK